MKYSDSIKSILLAAIDELAAAPEKYAKRQGKDFTRYRKLGFRQLLLMFLTMEGERILSRSKAKKRKSHHELVASYRYICADVLMDYLTDIRCEYDISLRIVRFETAPGIFVNLITNLPDYEFYIDDFKELYHLRWSQENAYRDIEYPLCLRALHSKKYEYVVKEIWGRTILHNFSSEIALHVEIDKLDRKYEYRVNYSEDFKICRDFRRIHDGKTLMDVEGLIAQNIEAVRSDRIFPRQKRFKVPMSFCYRN